MQDDGKPAAIEAATSNNQSDDDDDGAKIGLETYNYAATYMHLCVPIYLYVYICIGI